MGCGATPHEKETRGSAPNPASFLKRKRGKKNKPKTVFSAGELRGFAKVHFRLARKIRVFAEVRRLTGSKGLC